MSDGVSFWWMQRITAIVVLPLSFWFLCGLWTVLIHPSGSGQMLLEVFLGTPARVLAFLLFMSFALIHGVMGVRVVLQDYVGCVVKRIFLVSLSKLVAIVSFVLCVVSVLLVYQNFN